MKIRYPEYSPGEVLQRYLPCACGSYLWTLRNTNKHFWHRCRGMVDVVIFEPSLPVYLTFYFFFYAFLLPWKTFLSKTIIKANHSFQLWTPPWLYSYGSGTNLLGILLVFCNITNKIRKHTDTAVPFTQEYSRVSYPLGNMSTLPTGSGCPRTHTLV